MEIGLSTNFNKPETGYFFVMRAGRGAVDTADLGVAEDSRLVDTANRAIGTYPYFVFSIEVSDTRDDWFQIPEIATLHAELMAAVRKGKRAEVDELFVTFKRTVLTSADLLTRDAQRLASEVEEELTIAMPPSMTATSAPARELRPLQTIRLFETRSLGPHRDTSI